jgi:hypothetical protein
MMSDTPLLIVNSLYVHLQYIQNRNLDITRKLNIL